MTAALTRELLLRKWLHVLLILPAFLLPFLPQRWAIAAAAAALAWNVVMLPRTPGLRRLLRKDRRFDTGVVLYPLAVLLALIFLPYPAGAAACWGVLAAGDGAAGIAGRRYPLAPLPWNRRKSWGGIAAFFLAALVAGALLLDWCGVAPREAWKLAAAAALAAALVESAPLPVDDNLTVPLAAGGTLWLLMAGGP
ncbi:MAG: hypothetical protein L0Z55_05820 [Planctomycetes bacterium]|nr:hypothetical protein [Planctomycetota bacterium]